MDPSQSLVLRSGAFSVKQMILECGKYDEAASRYALLRLRFWITFSFAISQSEKPEMHDPLSVMLRCLQLKKGLNIGTRN